MGNVSFKNIIVVIFLVLLGIQTSLYKGYGDDLDSHALILTFINVYESGVYSPSRFYGSPFGELFYGFIGYNFGSFIGSFLSYCFFLFSIILIFTSYSKNKINQKDLFLFILICLSNPVLYLDNTNPSDYPLSLFLFSAALFLFKKNDKFYSIIFFALAIATRANFALLIIVFLIYEMFKDKRNYKSSLLVLFYSLTISSLFYFPIFIQSKFSLSFISNGGGPDLTFKALTPRFLYKSYLSIGVFSSIFIIYLLITNIKKVKELLLNNKDLVILISLNLLVFYFMPTKTSIISLVIILLYVFLFKLIDNKKYIYSIILFNFLFYVVSYQIFDFKYKYSKKCDPIEAIGAEFKFKISQGYYFKRTETMRNQIFCASKQLGENSQKYIKGSRIK